MQRGLLSRRNFLRAAATAPAAFKAGVTEALSAKVEQAVAAGVQAGVAAGPVPISHGIRLLTARPELMALYKAGLLPNWMRTEVEQSAKAEVYRLEPDVACLRSVSTSSKFRITQDRAVRRAWDNVYDMHALDMARTAFLDKECKK